MTQDDNTKAAVIYLLRHGLATLSEAANLAGRSRQIVRHWARELPADARDAHLAAQWKRAQRLAK